MCGAPEQCDGSSGPLCEFCFGQRGKSGAKRDAYCFYVVVVASLRYAPALGITSAEGDVLVAELRFLTQNTE